MDSSKLKKKSLKLLGKNYNYSILVSGLIILLLMDGACLGLSKVFCTMWLFPTLVFIVNSLFMMGYTSMILKVSRGKEIKTGNLFSSTHFMFRFMFVSLFIGLITMILFCLAALAFSSLTTCMKYFNEMGTALSIFVVTFGILLVAAILALGIYVTLSFSLTLFVLYDNPKLDVGSILRKSFDMTSDYFLEYLILILSFIGWFILGVITAGIGFIFIIPYFLVTVALFYNNIKKIYDKTTNDTNEDLINDDDLEKK